MSSGSRASTGFLELGRKKMVEGNSSVAALVAEGAFGIAEASTFTGLKRTFLYELMNRGELRFIKCGRRRLIPRAELTRLLAQSLVGSR
jgi:excisionase family DNA binding protein